MIDRVTETECIDEGVLIVFGDGVAALFSGPYLRAHLKDAVEVHHSESLPLWSPDATLPLR